MGTLTDEVWDVPRRRRTAVLNGVTGTHLAVRPDGELLVGEGRAVRLPSGRAGGHDLVQGDEIGALAFTSDGSLLAAGDQTGRVALRNGNIAHREGVLRNVFPAPHGTDPEGVSAVAFSPDGRTLAVGGDAGSLQLWDVATEQPLGSPLTTAGEAIDSLAFSSDGTTLYAGSAHVPLQRYRVDPEQAVRAVCRAGGRRRTDAGAVADLCAGDAVPEGVRGVNASSLHHQEDYYLEVVPTAADTGDRGCSAAALAGPAFAARIRAATATSAAVKPLV